MSPLRAKALWMRLVRSRAMGSHALPQEQWVVPEPRKQFFKIIWFPARWHVVARCLVFGCALAWIAWIAWDIAQEGKPPVIGGVYAAVGRNPFMDNEECTVLDTKKGFTLWSDNKGGTNRTGTNHGFMYNRERIR